MVIRTDFEYLNVCLFSLLALGDNDYKLPLTIGIIVVADAEEKTIAHIAKNNGVVHDAKQLAFAYSSSVLGLKELMPTNYELRRLEQESKFYEATGYADFPLSKYFRSVTYHVSITYRICMAP